MKNFDPAHAGAERTVYIRYDITTPGKFECQPVFAPYFWQMGLEGFADSDDGSTYGFRFKAGDADLETWPELKQWLGRKRSLKLYEDDQGFVHCF